MRFVIYRNSVLATICSMFGASFVVMAVGGMIGKEIEILPGVGCIAAGIALMWLAGIISERKEKRKRAKAAGKSAQAASAKPSRSTVQTANEAAVWGKPVKKCAVFAAIFFLLAFALQLWSVESHSIIPYDNIYLGAEHVMLIFFGLVLMLGAIRMRKIQCSSIFLLIGFLGLTYGSLDAAWSIYKDFGFGGFSTSAGIHYNMLFAPAVNAAALFLMTLFSLFSMGRIRRSLGGIVRCFWWLPVLAMIVAYVKWYDDNYIANAFTKVFNPRWIGLQYLPSEFLEGFARGALILAAFFTGISFKRACAKPAIEPQQTAHVQSEQPVQPRYTAPVYTAPKPEPKYTASEAPKPAPQPVNPEIEKKLQAYGILNQEEYDEKIRELK